MIKTICNIVFCTRAGDKMKALILAAGLGTRLLPFTEKLPKALFPIAGHPLLDIMICRLRDAGCEAVIVNTHHLHEKIAAFISQQEYEFPVYTRYEPEILGTGGAIKNAADFWDDRPFMVINSDIVTDIDLKAVYDFHLAHEYPVTMVLYDDPDFNSVSADKEGFVTGFCENSAGGRAQVAGCRLQGAGDNLLLTFTGIQVLDPQVLDFIPEGVFSSSISAYKKLISEQRKVKAFVAENCSWKDVGTAERYRNAVLEKMVSEIEKDSPSPLTPHLSPLQGDGSDRKWYRLTSGSQSFIVADHGISLQDTTSETDAFINIGKHLYNKGIPVPKIFVSDAFSGLVFLEDLGDVHLQTLVKNAENKETVLSYYKSVIDNLVKMSVLGAEGFDPVWTYQTPCYDKELILERECRYFVNAFLNGYLGMKAHFEDFEAEFVSLAEKALEFAVKGFMHRDMQSRNIMVKNGIFYFIDFQGGRIGPLQYDLASLLIDPYTALPFSMQTELRDYCIEKLSAYPSLSDQTDPEQFRRGFDCCSVTRNLQILGAFGHLSRNRGKTYFEQYIPTAVKTLRHHLSAAEFPKLKAVV